jgi:predicted XRE-type DNA-binding protein
MSQKISKGSTNVFADLGLPDAPERQTKTRLAIALNELIKSRSLKQNAVAALLGIPQPKVSAILNYRLDGFSVEKLMEFVTALNQDIEILIRPRPLRSGSGSIIVHYVTAVA